MPGCCNFHFYAFLHSVSFQQGTRALCCWTAKVTTYMNGVSFPRPAAGLLPRLPGPPLSPGPLSSGWVARRPTTWLPTLGTHGGHTGPGLTDQHYRKSGFFFCGFFPSVFSGAKALGHLGEAATSWESVVGDPVSPFRSLDRRCLNSPALGSRSSLPIRGNVTITDHSAASVTASFPGS